MVDLLFASSGIEPEIVRSAERLEIFAGVLVPVATAPHLLATKILAMDEGTRAQDRADALALVAGLDTASIETASEALRFITERGFHRGKDLQAELEKLLTYRG